MSFQQFCEWVESQNSWDRRIVGLSHPEANCTVFDTPKFGGIRVVQGPESYELNTGEVVNLRETQPR